MEQREILFRGKRKDDGEWVEGDLISDDGRFWIVLETYYSVVPDGYADAGKEEIDFYKEEILPETVGQFTGLLDKNGNKIFEGDVAINQHGIVFEIMFNGGMFAGKPIGQDLSYIESLFNLLYKSVTLEIVGNIHDNPELLKEVKE